MATDLKLEGIKFNMALSIFYIVYLLVEVPSNIILKRVGPRFYLPLLVCGFGLISMCTAFVQSYEGLLGARAMLGVFEGGAMPGMAFFLSCFYKRKELLFRIGIYVSAASIAGAFGGLLATGLSRIPEWGVEGARIGTWRNIFFFEGIITIISGLVAPIWMPTAPETAYFLTERERRIASERLVREQKASPNENVTFHHFKQAIFCIHNYTCAFGFFLINITVQGLSVFMPTILSDLGWTNTQAQLYSVPPYVCACIIAIAIAYISDKTNRRGIYLAIFAVLAVIGFAVLRWESSANVRYMAVFFVTIGAFPGGPAYLSWAMNSKSLLSRSTKDLGALTTTPRLGGTGRPSRDERVRGYPWYHWWDCRNVRAAVPPSQSMPGRSKTLIADSVFQVDLHPRGRAQVLHRPHDQSLRSNHRRAAVHIWHPLLLVGEQAACVREARPPAPRPHRGGTGPLGIPSSCFPLHLVEQGQRGRREG